MPKTEKTGRVPKPNGPYQAGSVEDGHVLEGKKGHELNSVIKIPDAPETMDRPHSKPSCGLARKKSDAHAHSGDHEVVRGRPYQYQKVRDAKPENETTKKCLKTQMGSNGRRGN